MNRIDVLFYSDEQLKSSQNFLLKEIQRLKQDFDKYTSKVNYANELRTIDQNTLKTFQNKFQDLTQVFRNLKEKELNTWQLVQVNKRSIVVLNGHVK